MHARKPPKVRSNALCNWTCVEGHRNSMLILVQPSMVRHVLLLIFIPVKHWFCLSRDVVCKETHNNASIPRTPKRISIRTPKLATNTYSVKTHFPALPNDKTLQTELVSKECNLLCHSSKSGLIWNPHLYTHIKILHQLICHKCQCNWWRNLSTPQQVVSKRDTNTWSIPSQVSLIMILMIFYAWWLDKANTHKLITN